MNKITLSKCIALLFLLTIFSKIAFAEQRSSVTQYGITWYFDGQYECGQFITGDWWVVGPVTVTHTDPAQTPGRNGTILNPDAGVGGGYDDRMHDYDASLKVSFPISVSGLSSLVSTISNPEPIGCVDGGGHNGWISRRGTCEHSPAKTMAVLTIVDGPVPAGTFRPSYIGNNYKELINVSNVDYNVLPHLPLLASTPDRSMMIMKIERPWLDHFNTWIGAWNFAIDNSQGYSRETSNDISEIAAALMLDIPELELLAKYMIQRGIDIYGGIQNGAHFQADGGNGSGRKWPVLFAGRLLNHSGMLNIGNDFSDYTFGEDCQTYYTTDGQPWWGIRHCYKPSEDDEALDSYRICCTSKTWVGQMLTALMLGLREEWNHEAYFDYVDRWISEGGGYGGNDWGVFIGELWNTYRDNLPAEIPHSGGSAPDTIAPTIPTGLTANNITGSLIDLSWNGATDNVRVTSYYIYKDGVFEQSVNSALLTAAISDLECNTTYEFTIRSRDAAGNMSDYSSPLSVATSSVCDPVNIALNKAITVSSEEATTPGTNLVDGITTDAARWSADGYPQWAEIDLGSNFELSLIELYTYQDRAYTYTIEAKPEGGAYSTIIDRSTNTQTTQPIYDFVSTSARYVKINITGANGYTGTWVSLIELKIFDNGGSSVPVAVDGVSLSQVTLTLEEGQSTDLTETVTPANATDKSVSWTSDNTSVATVDANGLVSAISAGNTNISVTTTDGGFTAICNVSVSAAQQMGDSYYCDPVNGSMSNDGSTSAPWASLEAVFAAGKTFTEGDNIYLLNGHHGSPVITGNNSSNVNILPATGQQPTMRCIKFNAASNWKLNNLIISPSTAPSYVREKNLIEIDINSSGITLEDCGIYSVDAPYTTVSDWTTNACNGFQIEGNYNSFLNNHVKNIKFGYRFGISASYNTIQNNVIENIAADGIQAQASYNIFENNIIRNCYDVDENHDDGIQIFTVGEDGNVGTGNSIGVVIRGNIIMSYTDPNQPLRGVFQGIGCFDGFYTNWTVENNLIVTNTWNGLALYGAVNCKIINNTVIAPDETSPSATWINITADPDGTPASGNIVSNNITNDIDCDAGSSLTENNIEINATDYASYFEDYANLNFNLTAGSPAIDAGTANNAPLIDILGTSRPFGTAYDVGCYEYTGAIVNVTGVSVAPETLTLELGQASQLIETVSPSDATNKSVSWSSDNTSVVSVINGLLTAKATGNAVITVTTTDGGYSATCNVTVIAPSGDYNLALGKPVSTTDEVAPDNTGSRLVDDDTDGASRWSADGFPQSAIIDLGEEYNLSRIEVYTYQDRAYQYIIEAGTDGSSFTQIVDRSANSTTSQPISDNVSATGRYIKITVSGADVYTGTWVSITELRVIGSPIALLTPVTGISVSPTSLTLEEGQTSDLAETVSPVDATDKTVTWASSDASVVSVDANGVVSAIAEGTATITVTTSDGGFTASCIVTVTAQPGDNNLALGKSVTVTAEQTPDNIGSKLVDGITTDDSRWSASGFPQSATIDLGDVYQLSQIDVYTYQSRAYQYNIQVSSDGSSYTQIIDRSSNTASAQPISDDTNALGRFIKVTISGAYEYTGTWASLTEVEVYGALYTVIEPTSVSLNQINISLDADSTAQLIETVSPADAADKSVVWSTSDASVADVDQNGVVTAITEGTASITVTTNVGGYTASCTVEVLAPSIITGSISREYWTDISGNYISDLTGSANYPSNPTGSDELSSLEAVSWVDPSVTTGIANNYGQRIRGYIIAPATGDYSFWIASDNCSDLYVSTDDDPGNMTRIAYVEGSTSQYQWTKYTTQKSVAISLVAGEAYYIEILHKDGCCGDNLAVGWAKPGEGTNAPSEIVPGTVLAPYYSAAKSYTTIKHGIIQSNKEITICPNILSNGDFRVLLSGYYNKNVEIMIVDITGKEVYKNPAVICSNKGVGSITLSVDGFTKGIYFVVASDGTSIMQQKLIVY